MISDILSGKKAFGWFPTKCVRHSQHPVMLTQQQDGSFEVWAHRCPPYLGGFGHKNFERFEDAKKYAGLLLKSLGP